MIELTVLIYAGLTAVYQTHLCFTDGKAEALTTATTNGTGHSECVFGTQRI